MRQSPDQTLKKIGQENGEKWAAVGWAKLKLKITAAAEAEQRRGDAWEHRSKRHSFGIFFRRLIVLQVCSI